MLVSDARVVRVEQKKSQRPQKTEKKKGARLSSHMRPPPLYPPAPSVHSVSF